jgi:5'-nucleotidase
MEIRIGIDMDSILTDIFSPWLAENNRRFNDDLVVAKITDWDTAKVSKGGVKVFDILSEKDFFLNLQPLPGAIEGVQQLKDAGMDLYIVSTPFNGYCDEKTQWVKKWFPWFDNKKLIFTHHKELIDMDLFFDDGPENIKAIHAAMLNRGYKNDKLIATISYPYNLHVHDKCDLVAGTYEDTARAWQNFADWVTEDGCWSD